MKLSQDLRWVGVLDKDLRTFDIIMTTEFGTSYNSYLLQAGEKTILFETAKARFDQEYFENLQVAQIDYVVVNHTEPDHVGCLAGILERFPQVEIIATPVAISYLKEILNRDFTSIPTKKDMELVIGNKTLRFFPLPNLHWPDSMFTYIVEEKALVTCDSFGAHYAHEGILRSTVTAEEDYLSALDYYFQMILAPFKEPFMQRGLDVAKSLDLSLICTGHGPVLDSHIEEILALYETWCAVPKKERKKVLIAYVSAYGYTKLLAETIEKELKQDFALEVLCYDLETAEESKVLEALAEADGILLGSPTMLQSAMKPVLDLLNHMTPTTHRGRVASAFGSYGWTGEAVPMLTQRLAQLKLTVVDGYTARFQPSGTEIQAVVEFARDFARKLKG